MLIIKKKVIIKLHGSKSYIFIFYKYNKYSSKSYNID